jgi:S-adenosylmethionine synthetase
MFIVILIALVLLIAGAAFFIPVRAIARLTQESIALKLEAIDAAKEMLRETMRHYTP